MSRSSCTPRPMAGIGLESGIDKVSPSSSLGHQPGLLEFQPGTPRSHSCTHERRRSRVNVSDMRHSVKRRARGREPGLFLTAPIRARCPLRRSIDQRYPVSEERDGARPRARDVLIWRRREGVEPSIRREDGQHGFEDPRCARRESTGAHSSKGPALQPSVLAPAQALRWSAPLRRLPRRCRQGRRPPRLREGAADQFAHFPSAD